MTITEKILAKHAGKDSVTPGEIVEVNVDKVFSHDVFTPFVIEEFEKKGYKIWDRDKIVFISDHEVPSVSEKAGERYQQMAKFAREQGITNFYYGEGICHQLMPEKGHVKPGQIVIGTDSHTVTYGALNTFSTGIGSKEMAQIWNTGKIWLKVPPTIKVTFQNKLQKGVYSKDLILHLLGKIKADGAVYKAIEMSGDTIDDLSMDARFTMTNMVVEMGAKNGIMKFDDKCKKYMQERNITEYDSYDNDEDAVFEKEIVIDSSNVGPQIAGPKRVDEVNDISGVEGLKIHQGFLGSCTNGRIEDLRIAASILKGKKTADYLKFIVTPASNDIFKQALKEGLIDIFLDCGAIVTNSSCGLCMGKSGGVLGKGEVAICSNNRNFPGRLGHKDSKVYLASPAAVAASVIEGKITDPRKYLND